MCVLVCGCVCVASMYVCVCVYIIIQADIVCIIACYLTSNSIPLDTLYIHSVLALSGYVQLHTNHSLKILFYL